MKYFQRIVDELQELDQFDPREIKGVSVQEIQDLESIHPANLPFPPSVREFLALGGRQIVYMRPSSGFYLKSIKNLLTVMEDQFLKPEKFHQRFMPNGEINFPSDGLIFFEHLDYAFEFIRITDEEDPPVYFFDNDPNRENFDLLYPAFSDAIYDFFLDFKDAHRRRLEEFPKLQGYVNFLKVKVLDILNVVDNNAKAELQDAWVKLRYCYKEIYSEIYKLYDLDTSAEIRISSLIDVYELYEESDMGGEWPGVLRFAKEIRSYFEEEVLKVIEKHRMSLLK